MKTVGFILLFLCASSTIHAQVFSKTFRLLKRNDLNYSSYVFIKKAVLNREALPTRQVEDVIDHIHPTLFIYDEELDKLKNFKSILDFPVGVRAFFQNDYSSAWKRLRGIKSDNNMYIESNYLLGLISLIKNKSKTAATFFTRCAQSSYNKKENSLKSEAYIGTFRNRCKQSLARLFYSAGQYQNTLKVLNTIRKTDYLWPKLLLDKAWTYYHLDQNARALGTVISYNSPALKRFTTPEARYLQALMYFEMCYYEKAESISNDFKQNIWKHRDIFKNNRNIKLLKLIFSKVVPSDADDKALYYYLKGFKKDTRYLSYVKSAVMLKKEIAKLKQVQSLSSAKLLLKYTKGYQRIMLKDFVDFLNVVVADYYDQIVKMKKSFTKIDLMIGVIKRKRLSQNKSLNLSEKKKSLALSQIPNTDDKFIWDFQGGYWADELGDYAVALRNRCVK